MNQFVFIGTILALYAIGWMLAFLGPYLALRKLQKEAYGEPTRDTVATSFLTEKHRTFILHLRDRGMEEYDKVLIRTPGWDEVEVMIPRPKPSYKA